MPPQFCLGKSFANYGPTGPALVSTDAFDDPDDIALWCDVAGERMQAARTTELIFSIPTLVAYLSSICPLYPGDLIFTGTPVRRRHGTRPLPRAGRNHRLGRRRHRRAPQHMPARRRPAPALSTSDNAPRGRRDNGAVPGLGEQLLR